MGSMQELNSPETAWEPSAPLVAISILNWNSWRHTLECIGSVRQLEYPNYLIVVVENGSGNESLAELRAWAKAHFREGGAFVEYSREVAVAGGDAAMEQDLQRCGSFRRLVLIRQRGKPWIYGREQCGDPVCFAPPAARRVRLFPQ